MNIQNGLCWWFGLLLVATACGGNDSGDPVDTASQDTETVSETVPPPDDTPPPPDDTVDPPGDSTTPPDDGTTPPGDGTTPPPDDTTTPPGDTSTPPEDTPAVDTAPPPPPVPVGAWAPKAASDSVSLAGEASVGYAALALDTDERPVIVYTEKILLPQGNTCPEENRHIHLIRFNGQEWTGPDGVTLDDTKVSVNPIIGTEYRFAFSPSVVVDANGDLIVAWTSALSCKMSGLQGTVMARRYVNGTGWEDFSAGSMGPFGITGTNYNQASKLKIDPMGRPTVVYMTTAPGYLQGFIYLRRFENGQWAGLDGSDGGTGLSGPDAEIFPEYFQDLFDMSFSPSGAPVVTWSTFVLQSILTDFSSVLLRYWDGKSWIGINGSGFSPGVVPDSGIAGQNVATTVTSDGRIHLAWSDLWATTPLQDEPLFYASALPSGNWDPADGGGAKGMLPPDHHVGAPSLVTAFDDRPVLGYIRHYGTNVPTTSDSINVLVQNTETNEWESLGGVPEVVTQTGWRVQPLGFVGTPNRVGMAWVENDPHAMKAGGGLYYLEFEAE